MKCISVYTDDFGQFSDIYDRVVQTSLAEDEETEIEGVTVCESGDVPSDYVERMRRRPDVVVMRQREHNVIILQHGSVFEIVFSGQEAVPAIQ